MFSNPYKPGAGHPPPFLAGRVKEQEAFEVLLAQSEILENVVLTGLRGVGKTVLLGEFGKIAVHKGWRWVGSDLSEESGGQSNDKIALRLLTDLAVETSQAITGEKVQQEMGFNRPQKPVRTTLDFNTLHQFYGQTPGLVADKLKATLKIAWRILSEQETKPRGLVFAYDEAQNLSDNSAEGEYPLSTLLEVFQALQKEGFPLMLVLTGLPTLFPKLVDARTYAERMFRVIELTALDETASREAIEKPLEEKNCPIRLTEDSVALIIRESGGYPYFIQFICREIYNVWTEDTDASVTMDAITAKLDRDFFAGRWDRATDRQRDLMQLIAELERADKEFSVQEIVGASERRDDIKSFGNSQVNQILNSLIEKGLIYRNRHGKYSFAVPLLADFIRRNAIPLL